MIELKIHKWTIDSKKPKKYDWLFSKLREDQRSDLVTISFVTHTVVVMQRFDAHDWRTSSCGKPMNETVLSIDSLIRPDISTDGFFDIYFLPQNDDFRTRLLHLVPSSLSGSIPELDQRFDRNPL